MQGLTRWTGALRVGAANAARPISSSAVLLAKRDPTLPAVPKGAPKAYSLFFKDFFGREKDNYLVNGKVAVSKIAPAAGEAWAALAESAKAEYASRADALRVEADAAYKEWYDALAPETRRAIEKATGKKLAPPGGKKRAKADFAARAGNPGRPLTSFFLFMRDVRDAVTQEVEREGTSAGEKQAEIARRIGDRWKALAEDEKKAFKDTYEAAKAKYDEWMKTQGSEK